MSKVTLHFKPIEIDTDDSDYEIFTKFDINRYLYINSVWDLDISHIEHKPEDKTSREYRKE